LPAKAERTIAEEFHRLGWTRQDLPARRKRDPEKLAIAARLRKETTLSLKQIATRVSLGTSKSANATPHPWMQSNPLVASRKEPIGI
jgi:lambda repressor-like predicted transcriptional regulator